ncbi:MFS transporter [Hymenobacter gummosus]|uniref:MFS transporter n=1 Tax=Hymenobacter gummosus TaxID=1776032 RepID=A0A431TWA1_9BACT|nr:MFS transporter [Hymenobacter gummosus]RTQ45998.1 MFS transporter [Hymenobacter gummosus]
MPRASAPTPSRTLPIIVVAQFCCTSLWFAGNAIAPDLAARLQQPAAFVAHLTSAVQLGFISGTLTFALLAVADRFSPSRVFGFCALAATFCNLGLLLPATGALLAGRFLTGFFLAGIYPVGMKIAADHAPAGLGKWLGFLVGALVLGTAFPHLLQSGALRLSWQLLPGATSVLAALGGLALWRLVPDGPYRRAGQRLQLTAFLSGFRLPAFRAAAFGYFGHMWELYTFWAFVPLMLTGYNQAHPGAALPVAAWSFGLIGVGSLACVGSGLLCRVVAPPPAGPHGAGPVGAVLPGLAVGAARRPATAAAGVSAVLGPGRGGRFTHVFQPGRPARPRRHPRHGPDHRQLPGLCYYRGQHSAHPLAGRASIRPQCLPAPRPWARPGLAGAARRPTTPRPAGVAPAGRRPRRRATFARRPFSLPSRLPPHPDFMDQTLRRGDGSIFLTLHYHPADNWVHAHWTGRQTLSTVMSGGLTHLDMIRQRPCAKLLNDHRDLVGTFLEANDWIQQVWTPLIIAAGLRSIGQVVSPDVFGQFSIEDLQRRISNQLDLYLFEDMHAAQTWLRAQ